MAGLVGTAGDGTSGGALALLARGRETVMALPPRRRSMLAAGALMLVAMCAGVAWWEGKTDWKVLYAGLEVRDLQQVEQELAAAGIGYETTADGAGVQVPAELLDKARMEVAAKGMPQTGRMGFELFDKPNWVGSEFDEKVNYQRALEGELEHTIATLGVVRSARVHLVLPKDSLFSEERDAERELEQKLVAMIEPLAGRENVRATVNISYDDTSQERTDEVVDPTQVATLSMQKREETSGQHAGASGVPGTASNTPAAAAAGSVAADAAAAAKAALPVYPTNGTLPQTSHEETGTYAVTHHTVHEEMQPGRVRRVTAAVVVNDRELGEGEGKTKRTEWRPRTIEEMKRMEQLAQAAIGYDEKRGDQVVMQNISFSANVPDPKVGNMQNAMEEAQSLLRSQPGLLKTIAGCGLAALLIFAVVRPTARQVIAVLSEPRELPSGFRAVAGLPSTAADETEQMVAELPRESMSLPKVRRRNSAAIDDDGVREYVSEHIRREPAQSRRLLEAWIGAKEDAA